jgi:hypothetical protein
VSYLGRLDTGWTVPVAVIEPDARPSSASFFRRQASASDLVGWSLGGKRGSTEDHTYFGIPSIPKISTSPPSRPGRAFSILIRYIVRIRISLVVDAYSLIRFQFMHLLNMNRKTASSIQSSRTVFAFEVLSLLMLHKDCAETCKKVAAKREKEKARPFSSSNSRSQYQHHGFKTWN